jgi:hypothetical protein
MGSAGRVMIAMMLMAACGGDDDACPQGLVAKGPGVCQVPGEPDAGKVAAVAGGKVADQPAGILPPSGGRGDAGASGGAGGSHAGNSAQGGAGSGGKVFTGGAGGMQPEPVVVIPRGGSGGSAAAGEMAPPVFLPPTPRCGDDIVQAGETCDGNCPADCDDGDPCTDDRGNGTADDCSFKCMHTLLQEGSLCGYNGRTCHAGVCYSEAEIAQCGNGTLDSGETCDTKSADHACPTECAPVDACHTVQLIGHTAACSARCLKGVARAGNVCPDGRCNDTGVCLKAEESRL